jgi:hypothetical protein
MPKGRIDVRGTMQAISDVMEGWVREHQGQCWIVTTRLTVRQRTLFRACPKGSKKSLGEPAGQP